MGQEQPPDLAPPAARVGSLDLWALPQVALVLVDSAPIIYVLEGHARLASRFQPLFERQAAGDIAFAVATITITEVLTGPLGAGEPTRFKRRAPSR